MKQVLLLPPLKPKFPLFHPSDILAGILGILFFLALVPVITYAYFAKDLNSKEIIMNTKNTGFVLLDRNNKPFFTFNQGIIKKFVPLEQISDYSKKAAIASEDKDFYSHPGFSIPAIIRSIYQDIKVGSFDYGGSTITQQLVKNALLNSQKNFLRKYQEIVLASEIERRYSKEEILEMYLNSVYFGEGAFGIEEASKIYFDKDAKDLNLSQGSFLIGLLPAPSHLSPLSGSLPEAKLRQKYVLNRMVEQSDITPSEAEAAYQEKLEFNSKDQITNNTAIHFAIMVADELKKKYGEEVVARSGFKVRTTLDLNYQQYAEEVVKEQVKKLKNNSVSNGAAVVQNPKNGEILALIGSYNWYDEKFGKVNIALSKRQPGSAFKPIVYSAALEQGLITPATILQDASTTFAGNYKPKDYDSKFRGPVTARRALANSLNVPSVQVMSKVGVIGAIDMAKRLGLTTLTDPSQYGLSLVLGAGEVKLLELTNAYAVFANNGIKNESTSILEIQDKFGQTIYTYQANPQPVLDPGVAFLISSILSDNSARREIFGNTLTISRPAAVKTGTTENYKDAWTLGYTPSIVVGVWVGNNDGKSMDNVAGSLGAAPIWANLMEKFLKETPLEQFTSPKNVVTYSCRTSQDASASAILEYSIKGQISSNCLTLTPSPNQNTSTKVITPVIKSAPPQRNSKKIKINSQPAS